MSHSEVTPVLVLCPTEYGGHIEHAADLAIALARRQDVGRCLLVSRPGAAGYLGPLGQEGVEAIELLPPRRLPAGGLSGRLRPLAQVLDLVVEHRRLRTLLKRLGPRAIVLFESPKYPIPALAVGPTAETVLFVHNARPHVNDEHIGVRQRVLTWLERRSIAGVDRLVTHGRTQLETLAASTSTPAAAVPLPTGSALDLPGGPPGNVLPREPYALCIGELRPNKGVELAMGAAAASGVRLLVAGKSESASLSRDLSALAAASEHVQLRDEFLSAGEFEALIRAAALVVLPYTHFDAQSGILSKAMGAGVPVLAADLPALRDQANCYRRITHTDIHDPQSFASDLASAFARSTDAQAQTPGAAQDATEQWDAVAAAVMGCPIAVLDARH